MLEDGDGGHWKDPDTTISANISTTTSVSHSPLWKHKIEWVNSAGGKAMREFGCHLPDELDNASMCVLCGMKTMFYFVGCFD